MAGEPEAKDASAASAEAELGPWVHDPHVLAWATEHLPELRRSVSEQRTLRWSLGAGFLVGLVAHVSGFLLKTSTTTEPLELLADLLYTLGWALWTGVVVTVFFQIAPQAKARQIKQAGDALEVALREKGLRGAQADVKSSSG
jgi:hypothetical protein